MARVIAMLDPRDSTAAARRQLVLFAVLVALVIWCSVASVAVVDSTEYALVLRFGRIVRVIDAPGLALILPFDRVQRLDRRLLFFSPPPAEYLTLDKKNVVVQPLLAWRIANPERFFSTVANRPSAEVRLADVVLAEIGSVLGHHPFAALVSDDAKARGGQRPVAETSTAVAEFARAAYGVEVVEIGLRQLSLPEQNRQSVFERMRAERGRLAKRYRSEGELEAKRIIAGADQEKVVIGAEAYAEAQRLRAEGDAEAAHVYASAYGRDPSLYRFLRTLQAYAVIIDENTTFVLPSSAEALGALQDRAKRGPVLAAPALSNAVQGQGSTILLEPGRASGDVLLGSQAEHGDRR
jgi:modulator of FtsH protease HflC